jgi:hypothetical protein
MFGRRCSVSDLYYSINPDENRLQDTSYIGDSAASNTVRKWLLLETSL